MSLCADRLYNLDNIRFKITTNIYLKIMLYVFSSFRFLMPLLVVTCDDYYLLPIWFLIITTQRIIVIWSNFITRSWVVICYPVPQLYPNIHCLQNYLVLLYFSLLFLVVYAPIILKRANLRLHLDRKGKQ